VGSETTEGDEELSSRNKNNKRCKKEKYVSNLLENEEKRRDK
jgi:hypothetical protein